MQQDLRQKDFSNLAIRDMSPAERAELLRRYSHFVEHFRMDDPPAAPPKPLRKWNPGERT
ncbi:MAG: hypothetical protein ACREFQ_13000 [Stellaceae bacterium]